MHRIHSTGEGRCASGGHSETGHHDVGDVMRFAMSHPGGDYGRHGGPGGDRGRHRYGGPFGGGAEGGFGGFGGGFGLGGPRGRGRGRKARRGDIRTAALLLLAEEPRNGYQIMQEVQERSDGVWRPSPGSVYPALAQLEDEGLIRSEDADGRKLFALTDDGRAAVQERGEDKPAPWEQMSGDVSDQAHELGKLMREVAHAFAQVMRTGGKEQMSTAREVLTTARRDLYRILADGEPRGSGGESGRESGRESGGESGGES